LKADRRRNRLVHETIKALVAEGTSPFRPGHVADRLRQQNRPLGAWEIRAEFSQLASAGVIELIEETGEWRLAATAGNACAAG
jgi:hypothetical protein